MLKTVEGSDTFQNLERLVNCFKIVDLVQSDKDSSPDKHHHSHIDTSNVESGSVKYLKSDKKLIFNFPKINRLMGTRKIKKN